MQTRPRLSDEDIERAATKACRRLGYDRQKEEQLRVTKAEPHSYYNVVIKQ